MKQFFKLIQLGLEIADTNTVVTNELSALTPQEWTAIKEMAEKQGVSAIVLDGLNKLEECGYKIESLSTEQKLEWIGSSLLLEQGNRHQKNVMEDMSYKWKNNGCKVMVMKGQASATMYPQPEHRSPGDIDCYLINDDENHNENGYQIGNEVAREAGAKVDESWYKHSVISYKGETFENHQYFVHTRDGKRGKQLEKELEETLKEFAKDCKPLTKSTLLPPIQWTAMFLTYHACGHFVSEGLRIKQLLDWAMLLHNHQDEIDWERFYVFCDKYHLRRFADAATAICVKYLGIKIRHAEITTTSPYTNKILENTLYDDDYVFNSGMSGWTNRLHLVKNLFHYRWKYEEICEDSIYKQLWYYATGFLFKTEQ